MNTIIRTGSIKAAALKLMTSCLLLIVCTPFSLLAQTDSVTAVEEKTLISPSLDLVSIQKSDNTIDLKATLKAKINGTFVKLYGMKVVFGAGSDSTSKELGKLITDRNGIAILNYKTDELTSNAEGAYHFKANFEGNKSAEATEAEVTVKKAKLIITPVKEDSVLSVKAILLDLSSGEEKPIPETDLAIFVKRSFNPLKLGEGKTDANGEVSVEIPTGLPGDSKGNITLLARLDDNETFGNLEASVVQQWGTAVSNEIKELPRALWSPHPPLWMLITFIILMVAVWGHYIVIVYELFRLRKEQPGHNNLHH